jgi:predicted ABC-type transport system involved in lysophospholipase L1 biosynthesis ATPase subunit
MVQGAWGTSSTVRGRPMGRTRTVTTGTTHMVLDEEEDAGTSCHPPKIRYVPSHVEFRNVSHSIPPPSRWQQWFTLTRSRTWALHQVSLSLNDGALVLLTGASASGKSTLLRLLAAEEAPTLGTVVMAASPSNATTAEQNLPLARPVLLDVHLSPYGGLRYESRQTLQMILQHDLPTGFRNPVGIAVLHDLLTASDLAARVNHTPTQLTPSEWHMFVVVRAALASMLAPPPGLRTPPDAVPGPILGLDEAWDRETPVVLHALYHRLQRLLSQTGGIAILATHVPARFPAGAPRGTLCRGAWLRPPPPE